jgi:hypothetical protein
LASAFLTSDWEIRNCLAIADGLTPALKAARTAFCWPEVNPEPISVRRKEYKLIDATLASLGGMSQLGHMRTDVCGSKSSVH